MKAAVVDTTTGDFVTQKHRIDTPRPATPDALADVARQLTEHFEWEGQVGVGFPGVIQRGIVRTAANLDDSWIDVDGDALFTEASQCDVHMINDADAAGLAEVRFGVGEGVSGVVIMLTLGTGIGSAVFFDGELVPNTEFGHLLMDGVIAEDRASSRAKEDQGLSWEEWGIALRDFLLEMDKLFWPELFMLGGGISKQFEHFAPFLEGVRAPIKPAERFNRAGIVGAALCRQPISPRD